MESERMIEDADLLNSQINRLTDLGKEIKGDSLVETALMDSIFDFVYILQRIQELAQILKIDITTASQDQLNLYFRSNKALNFYSQCLLIWSCRILDILRSNADVKVPPEIKLARNILAAHYGTADGNLKSNLTREKGFTVGPQLSPNGSFKYVVGPLGSPASTASSSELDRIKDLFKKYCPGELEFNWWFACHKILHQDDREIAKEDLKEIEGFIRDNGGMITNSQYTIKCVVESVEKYIENYVR